MSPRRYSKDRVESWRRALPTSRILLSILSSEDESPRLRRARRESHVRRKWGARPWTLHICFSTDKVIGRGKKNKSANDKAREQRKREKHRRDLSACVASERTGSRVWWSSSQAAPVERGANIPVNYAAVQLIYIFF